MQRIAIGTALALIFCGLLTGCDNTTCEQAVTKLEGECGLGSGVSLPDSEGTIECYYDKDGDSDNGIPPNYSECIAGCVLDSACEDITDKVQDPAKNPYWDCVRDCK